MVVSDESVGQSVVAKLREVDLDEVCSLVVV